MASTRVKVATEDDDLAKLYAAINQATTLCDTMRPTSITSLEELLQREFPQVKAVLARARSRVGELEAEAARRSELAALGLSAIPYPDDFCCPITYSKFVDPVVASDGHTYERSAIAAVIHGGNRRSPLTREWLEDSWVPNRALLRRMQAYQEETIKVARLAAAEATRQDQGKADASSSGEAIGSNSPQKRGGEDVEPSTSSAPLNKRARRSELEADEA